MCQLIFCNINNRNFLRKYTLFQAIIDSNGRHDDGYGHYYEGGNVLRTKIAAKNISNLGDLLSDVNKTKIMAHCRDASIGIPVEDIYSHPFESNNFILAHNGALNVRDGIILEKTSLSDSENFLFVLDKVYEKDNKKDVPKAISNTMKNFHGTFAFLIYEKKTKLFYAVRGKTKTLFTSEITIDNTKGYVINTEKDSLDQCTTIVKKLMELDKTNIEISDSKVLEAEKIYLLGETIKEVGTIKETSAPVYIGWVGRNRSTTLPANNTIKKGIDFVPPLPINVSKLFDVIEEWLWLHNLSLRDLDLALFTKYGTTKLSCSEGELEDIFEILKSAVNITDATSAKVFKFVREWGQLSSDFYIDYKLQFPYFINTDLDVIEAIEKETLFRIKERAEKQPILL